MLGYIIIVSRLIFDRINKGLCLSFRFQYKIVLKWQLIWVKVCLFWNGSGTYVGIVALLFNYIEWSMRCIANWNIQTYNSRKAGNFFRSIFVSLKYRKLHWNWKFEHYLLNAKLILRHKIYDTKWWRLCIAKITKNRQFSSRCIRGRCNERHIEIHKYVRPSSIAKRTILLVTFKANHTKLNR